MPKNNFRPEGVNGDSKEVLHDIAGDGKGSVVVANPDLAGDEEELEGIEVDGDKFKIPAKAVANPVLVGDEEELTGLEVDGTKYKVPQPAEPVASLKLYKHVLSGESYEAHIVSAREDAYESMEDVLGDDTVISMKAVKKDVSLDCPLLKSSSTSAFKVVIFGDDSLAMSDLAFADLGEDTVTEIVNA